MKKFSISVSDMKKHKSEIDYKVPGNHIDVDRSLGRRFEFSRIDKHVYK